MEKERKVLSTQKYTVEVIRYDDGFSTLNRVNNGFSVLEMIGISTMIQQDMLDLLKNNLKPFNEVNRSSVDSPVIHKPEVKKLNKQEAIQEMLNGKRLTHRFFEDGEWVTIMEDDFYLFNDGVKITGNDFWKDRSSDAWGQDWEIFNEEK